MAITGDPARFLTEEDEIKDPTVEALSPVVSNEELIQRSLQRLAPVTMGDMARASFETYRAKQPERGVGTALKEVFTKTPMLTFGKLLDMVQGMEGTEVSPETMDWADRKLQDIRANERVRQALYDFESMGTISGKVARQLVELPNNASFTMANVVVGSPFYLLGGVGPLGHAMAIGAGYGSIFRMSRAELTRTYLETLQNEKFKETGEYLTEAEEQNLKADFEPIATRYANWEAIPESVSLPFLVGALKSLVVPKVGKRVAKNFLLRAFGHYGAIWAEQQAQETVTEIGQSQALHGTPMMDGEPLSFTDMGDIWEATKRTAPQTFLISALFGGLGGATSKTYRTFMKDPLARDKMVGAVREGKFYGLDNQSLARWVKTSDMLLQKYPKDRQLYIARTIIATEYASRIRTRMKDVGISPAEAEQHKANEWLMQFITPEEIDKYTVETMDRPETKTKAPDDPKPSDDIEGMTDAEKADLEEKAYLGLSEYAGEATPENADKVAKAIFGRDNPRDVYQRQHLAKIIKDGTFGLDEETRKNVDKNVREYGSIEKVEEKFAKSSPIGHYARWRAKQIWAEKEEAEVEGVAEAAPRSELTEKLIEAYKGPSEKRVERIAPILAEASDAEVSTMLDEIYSMSPEAQTEAGILLLSKNVEEYYNRLAEGEEFAKPVEPEEVEEEPEIDFEVPDTVKALKAALKELGESTEGKKAELKIRYIEAMRLKKPVAEEGPTPTAERWTEVPEEQAMGEEKVWVVDATESEEGEILGPGYVIQREGYFFAGLEEGPVDEETFETLEEAQVYLENLADGKIPPPMSKEDMKAQVDEFFGPKMEDPESLTTKEIGRLPKPDPTAAVQYQAGVNGINALKGALRAGHSVSVVISKSGHKGAQLSNTGREHLTQELINNPEVKVFVDTGAFTAFTKKDPHTLDDFKRIYDRMKRLFFRPLRNAKEEKPLGQLEIVAPDVIGDQRTTMDYQLEFAKEMEELAKDGAIIVIPLQRNPEAKHQLSPDKLMQWVKETFKNIPPEQMAIGFPSNAEAWSIEEIGKALTEMGDIKQVHFLGRGWSGNLTKPAIEKVLETIPDAIIRMDATDIRRLAKKEVKPRADKKISAAAVEELKGIEWLDPDVRESVFNRLYELGEEVHAEYLKELPRETDEIDMTEWDASSWFAYLADPASEFDDRLLRRIEYRLFPGEALNDKIHPKTGAEIGEMGYLRRIANREIPGTNLLEALSKIIATREMNLDWEVTPDRALLEAARRGELRGEAIEETLTTERTVYKDKTNRYLKVDEYAGRWRFYATKDLDKKGKAVRLNRKNWIEGKETYDTWQEAEVALRKYVEQRKIWTEHSKLPPPGVQEIKVGEVEEVEPKEYITETDDSGRPWKIRKDLVARSADTVLDEAQTQLDNPSPALQASRIIKGRGLLNLKGLQQNFGEESIQMLINRWPGLVSSEGKTSLDEVAMDMPELFKGDDDLIQALIDEPRVMIYNEKDVAFLRHVSETGKLEGPRGGTSLVPRLIQRLSEASYEWEGEEDIGRVVDRQVEQGEPFVKEQYKEIFEDEEEHPFANDPDVKEIFEQAFTQARRQIDPEDHTWFDRLKGLVLAARKVARNPRLKILGYTTEVSKGSGWVVEVEPIAQLTVKEMQALVNQLAQATFVRSSLERVGDKWIGYVQTKDPGISFRTELIGDRDEAKKQLHVLEMGLGGMYRIAGQEEVTAEEAALKDVEWAETTYKVTPRSWNVVNNPENVRLEDDLVNESLKVYSELKDEEGGHEHFRNFVLNEMGEDKLEEYDNILADLLGEGETPTFPPMTIAYDEINKTDIPEFKLSSPEGFVPPVDRIDEAPEEGEEGRKYNRANLEQRIALEKGMNKKAAKELRTRWIDYLLTLPDAEIEKAIKGNLSTYMQNKQDEFKRKEREREQGDLFSIEKQSDMLRPDPYSKKGLPGHVDSRKLEMLDQKIRILEEKVRTKQEGEAGTWDVNEAMLDLGLLHRIRERYWDGKAIPKQWLKDAGVEWLDQKLSIRSLKGRFRPVTIEQLQEMFPAQDFRIDEEGYISIRLPSGHRLIVERVSSLKEHEHHTAPELDQWEVDVRYGQDETEVVGGYHREGKVARIILHETFGDLRTAAHEYLHLLRDLGIIDSKDYAILKGTTKRFLRQGKLEARYPKMPGSEEDVAEVFGMLYDAPPPKGPLAQIIAKVKEFFQMLAKMAGIRTSQHIINEVKTHEIWNRARLEQINEFVKTFEQSLGGPAPEVFRKSLGERLADVKVYKGREATEIAIDGAAMLTEPSEYNAWLDSIRDEYGEATAKNVDKEAQRLYRTWTETVPNVLDRVVGMWRNAEGHLGWYERGREAMEKEFGEDADLFMQFFAIASANRSVASNYELAKKAYDVYRAGTKNEDGSYRFSGMSKSQKAKLEQAIRGEPWYDQVADPAFRKIHNFYKALKGDPDAVAVDMWLRLAFNYPTERVATDKHGKPIWEVKNKKTGEKDLKMIKMHSTASQVDFIESAVRMMSKQSKGKYTPRDIQEMIWMGAKMHFEGPETDISGVENLIQRASIAVLTAELRRNATFRKWFADSKVVDEQGEPIVVYHGTHAPFIDAFYPWSHFGDSIQASTRVADRTKSKIYSLTWGEHGKGNAVQIEEVDTEHGLIYRVWDVGEPIGEFDSREEAREAVKDYLAQHLKDIVEENWTWAKSLANIAHSFDVRDNIDYFYVRPLLEKAMKGANLIQAFLKIDNPLVLPDLGNFDDPIFLLRNIQKLHKLWDATEFQSLETALASPAWVQGKWTPSNLPKGMALLTQALQNKGYDGISYENAIEGEGSAYIIFDPRQVKSINNVGTFSDHTTDMMFRKKKKKHLYEHTLEEGGILADLLPPDVLPEWERARGLSQFKPTNLERFWETAKQVGRSFLPGREYKNLPQKQFPHAVEILRNYRETPRIGKERARDIILEVLKPEHLSKDEYEVFTLKLSLEDMLKDFEPEGPLEHWEMMVGQTEGRLPFGFESKEQIEETLAKVNAVVAENQKVQFALERREKQRERLVKLAIKHNLLPESVGKDPRYIHHQVLKYAEMRLGSGVSTFSRGMRPNVPKRGYQIHRLGSLRDYNTEYFESEFEWLAQVITQIEGKQNHDEMGMHYDNKKKFARMAKNRNLKTFYEIIYDPETAQYDDKGAAIDPLKRFRINIAKAMDKLGKFAAEGKLWGAGEYDDVIEQLSDSYNQRQADKQDYEDEPEMWTMVTAEKEKLFQYLQFLVKTGEAGAGPASDMLKSIHERNKTIETTIRKAKRKFWDAYLIAEDTDPHEGSKGWVVWVPEPMKAWYKTMSIDDKLLERFTQKVLGRELTENDFREVLARGHDIEWIIPAEVAHAMDNVWGPSGGETVVGRSAEQMLNWWKRWILFNPMRIIKYNVNNMSGDLDISLAADPYILKYAWQAAKDLRAWHRRHQKGGFINEELYRELDRWQRDGVIGSGMTMHDIPDIGKGTELEKLKQAITGQKPHLIKRYWRASLSFSIWRENVLRLAAARRAYDRLEKGETIYWASNKEKVDAAPDSERRAALLARELIGDYGAISEGGMWLRRKMIPFYSWMEINAPRYVQLMRNLPHEGQKKGQRAAMLSVVGAKKTTMLAMKASILFAMVNMWNHMMFPDEEEELGEVGRRQMHMILPPGRREDGTISTLRFQGALSDALAWFGAEDFPQDVREIAERRKTVWQFMAEAPIEFTNKLYQGMRPDLKGIMELTSGRSTWPDLTKGRPIRDKMEHISRTFSLDWLYKRIAGKPIRGGSPAGRLFQDLMNLATYTNDPGEVAYHSVRRWANEFAKQNQAEKPMVSPTDKGNALYYYKQALKYGDANAAYKYLKIYKEDYKGKVQGLRISIKLAHPIGGLQIRFRNKFKKSFTPEQIVTYDRAVKWYRETYLKGRRKYGGNK